MEGLVTNRGVSPKGKPTVHIDGKLYYCGKTDMGSVSIGDRIEFEASAFGERGNLWGINRWKLLQGASKYPNANQQITRIDAPAPSNGLSEGERAAVSNWVAHAIAAGLIKDPADLGRWANASRHAIRFAVNPDEGKIP
jgi:hypothetical protein